MKNVAKVLYKDHLQSQGSFFTYSWNQLYHFYTQ